MKNLPKSYLTSPRGQVLIIFLMILVVAAAIVLSVASRTITDIRTTTTSDESNRAYYAAEAGIEEALQRTGFGDFNLDFTSLNNTEAKVTVSGIGRGYVYVSPSDVAKDDVIQINMMSDYNDLSSDGWQKNKLTATLTFFWGATSDDLSSGTPAIEVSLVHSNANNISKFALDPNTTRAVGNNFCTQGGGVVKTDPPSELIDDTFGESIPTKFYFHTTINFRAAVPDLPIPDCSPIMQGGVDWKPNRNFNFLRIRTLYSQTPIGVVVGLSPDDDLGQDPLFPQGTVIESVGQTASGVTRKLQVFRPYPALPAIFDYVLFNGSPQPLKK